MSQITQQDFCKDMPAPGAGQVARCESFQAAPLGAVPAGWIGGGMAVQKNTSAGEQGTTVLAPTGEKENYQIAIPWKFGGDYDLVVLLAPEWGKCGSFETKVLVGGVTLTAARSSLGDEHVALNNSPKALNARMDPGSVWRVQLQRTGNVYKLNWGGKNEWTGRYDDAQDPQGITIQSGSCGFAVSGVKVRGQAS